MSAARIYEEQARIYEEVDRLRDTWCKLTAYYDDFLKSGQCSLSEYIIAHDMLFEAYMAESKRLMDSIQ